MAVVTLQILAPPHGSDFAGSGAVRLRGAVLSSGHPPLFFKWYSSLVPPPAPTSKDASIPLPAGANVMDFTPAAGLPLGSQVITFSAKDVAGESPSELQSVLNAGMAGGPAAAANPAPCVIHVYLASIAAPAAGAILSKAAATLAASAPRGWDQAEYQQINALRFRWKFTPSGAPAGRASADLVPTLAQLAFNPQQQRVTYSGALPGALGTGNYNLTLRVEKISSPTIGHEATRAVVLTA